MRISPAQLDLLGLDKTFATDEQLSILNGVLRDTLVERMSNLSDAEIEKMGIRGYIHPPTHPASMIVTDTDRSFVNQNQLTKLEDTMSSDEIRNEVSRIVMGLDWQNRVENIGELTTKYPNPEEAYAVYINELNAVYRYSATRDRWEDIMTTLLPLATETVSGMMTPAMVSKLNSIEPGANKFKMPESLSADILIPGNRNLPFTHDDKKKLETSASAKEYVHPPTHPASMIVESKSQQFVSEKEKAVFNDKYTKAQVDAKIDGAKMGLKPLPAVRTYDELAIKYPNAVEGSWAEVTTTTQSGKAGRYFVTETGKWEYLGPSTAPLASDINDGLMSSKDFTKLKGLDPNVRPHGEGDGYYHLPEYGNDYLGYHLVAGAEGLNSEFYIQVKNKAIAFSTIVITYDIKEASTNPREINDNIVIKNHVRIVVNRDEPINSIGNKIKSQLDLDQQLTEHFEIGFVTTQVEENGSTEDVVRITLKSKKRKFFEYLVVSKEAPTGVVDNTLFNEGEKPEIESFTITITHPAGENGTMVTEFDGAKVTTNVLKNESTAVTAARLARDINSTHLIAIHNDPLNSSTVLVSTTEPKQVEDPTVTNYANGLMTEVAIIKQGTSGRNHSVDFTISGINDSLFCLLDKDYDKCIYNSDTSANMTNPMVPRAAYLLKVSGTLAMTVTEYSTANGNIVEQWKRTFTTPCEEGIDSHEITRRLALSMNSDDEFRKRYLASIFPNDPNRIRITRNYYTDDTVFKVTLADVFSNVNLRFKNTEPGLHTIAAYWEVPLSINGTDHGEVSKEDLEAVLDISDIKGKIENLIEWKDKFNDLDIDEDGNLIKTLNDLIMAYEEGTLAGVECYSDKFIGYSSPVKIDHSNALDSYTAYVTPTSDSDGYLGEVWIEKYDRYVLVYNTGSSDASFDLVVQRLGAKK